MKTRILFILVALAIIAGFGFRMDKSNELTTSESMVGFYLDIYAYNISAQGNVCYEISGNGTEWTNSEFDPSANKPQVHYCAPYSSFYGEICVYLEYYGTEGCIRFGEIRKQGYFYWPATYDFIFTSYAHGDCDK